MTDPYLSVRNPLQYMNGEVNTVRKDFEAAAVRVVLAFPDLYELGMSHLGLKILYEVLNGQDDVLTERVFSPWLDREEQLRRGALPLTSLESGRPLSNFDLIGFTLPYELTYTNILNMLDLAQLPLRAEDRTERHPLVGGGGPSACNPEPLAEFFDFFLIGDGEEAILEITALISDARAAGAGRDELLLQLSRVEGVYVPRFYRPTYDASGHLLAVTPTRRGLPARIKKRVLPDLDSAPFPVRPPVPFLETAHDRITVEIARGCTRRCRFCQAGTTYLPYRERSSRLTLEMIEKGLAATGYDEVSLSALSCGDHSRLESLLTEIMRRYGKEMISVSLPSLRPGTLSEGILREIKRVKRTGFTIAPEAGSQRLRDVISKGISEEEIVETCTLLFREGWTRIKLYFMIGLPTEGPEDHQAILELVEKIRRLGREILGRNPQLSASVSGFVPKPHTPFQWVPQVPPKQLRLVLSRLRDELRRRGVNFKWHQPELSGLEGTLSRGDRRLSRVLHTAWRKGCKFDGWTERFDYQPWVEAFHEHNLDPDRLISRTRLLDEVLPWDHLTTPRVKNHLIEEYHRSLAAVPSAPCRPGECPDCGLCDDFATQGVMSEGPSPATRPYRPARKHPPPEKLRVEFSKFGVMKYLPHLSLFRTFYRALRRAGIPLAFSQGHTPHPKIQFGPPLPLGYEGEAEYMDLEITSLLNPDSILRQLSAVLPPGLEVRRLVRIPLKSRSLFDIVNLQTYRAILPKERLPDPDPGEWLLSRIVGAEKLLLHRSRNGKTRTADMRPLVTRAELIGEDVREIVILLALRRSGDLSARPSDVLRVAGGFGPEEDHYWKITRTANLVVQDKQWYSPINLPDWLIKRALPICRR